MNTSNLLKDLGRMPSWEWPDEAADLILRTLRDKGANPDERLEVARLAVSLSYRAESIAQSLLILSSDPGEPDELREEAILSLEPLLKMFESENDDEVDAAEDDPSMLPFGLRRIAGEAVERLRNLYADLETTERVRRTAFEVSTLVPDDWHDGAIRDAYNGKDLEWRLSAVVAMGRVAGFDDQILEALASDLPEIRGAAIRAAGNWTIDAAWPWIERAITSKSEERSVRLEAIEAAPYIRPKETIELLRDLKNSSDRELAEAAEEAVGQAVIFSNADEDEEVDELDEWDDDEWDDEDLGDDDDDETAAWFDTYNSLPAGQREALLLKTLKEPMPGGLARSDGMVDIILNYLSDCEDRKDWDRILETADTIRARRPAFFEQSFHYFESRAIDVRLFRRQRDQLDFASFKERPGKAIDTLIPFVEKLLFYGDADLALDIAKHVFPLVKDAPGLVAGTEDEFATVVFMLAWQEVYEAFKAGRRPDREAVIRTLMSFDYEIADEEYEEIERNLLSPGMASDFSRTDPKDDPPLAALNMAFVRYMLDEKGMNFAAADRIWMGVVGAFEGVGGDRDKQPPRHISFFALNKERFDRYLASRMGWISTYQANGFGVLWGAAYLYDFLFTHGWITQEVRDAALGIVSKIKREVLRGYRHELWKYDFVHAWTRPDSILEEEFDKESELFRRSFVEEIKKTDPLLRDPERQRSRQTNKVGRNDPCPCGSGKKYKKCCLHA